MDWFIAHILDIAALLIIFGFIFWGRKKGIIRMLLSLAGFAVSAALAAFVSNSTYEYVYIHAVQPSVTAFIEEKADILAEEYASGDKLKEILGEQYSGSEEDIYSLFDENEINGESTLLTKSEFRGTLNSIFTEYCARLTESLSGVLPEEIIESAENYLEENNIADSEKVAELKKSNASVPELIEKEIVRPVMMKTVKNVIFAVSFAVFCAVISVLIHIAGLIRKINAVRVPDSFLGGILGFIYALLAIMALSLLCSIFIKLTGDVNPIVSSKAVSGTYFFKYAYSGTFAALSLLLK
ncbi:MAG: hypothetical protein ACI4J6_02505 [Oscillospiraceae bacterium]